MSIKYVIIVQIEFLCFMNDNVFFIPSNEVLLEKLKEESITVVFSIIVIFTKLAYS